MSFAISNIIAILSRSMSYGPECDKRCQSFKNALAQPCARGNTARLLAAVFFKIGKQFVSASETRATCRHHGALLFHCRAGLRVWQLEFDRKCRVDHHVAQKQTHRIR